MIQLCHYTHFSYPSFFLTAILQIQHTAGKDWKICSKWEIDKKLILCIESFEILKIAPFPKLFSVSSEREKRKKNQLNVYRQNQSNWSFITIR